MDYVFGEHKETKEEKKNRKKQEHMHRAKCIEEYQNEALRLQNFLKRNKDQLTKGEVKALKAKFKEAKGMVFELKHPILNGTKNFLGGLYELFEDIMDATNETYEQTYGGKDYTQEDMQRVAMAMTQFGAAAADKVRGEIDSRIEHESSKSGPEPENE